MLLESIRAHLPNEMAHDMMAVYLRTESECDETFEDDSWQCPRKYRGTDLTGAIAFELA